MFWLLVTLLIIYAIVRGIVWLVREFFLWLGRGKRIHRVAESQNVPEDVQIAARGLEMYHAAKALGQEMDMPLRLTPGQRKLVRKAEAIVRENFLDNLEISWYPVVIIFFVGSVGGLIIEEIWMFITAGLTQSRVGLVWGPFSPLYGVGAVLLTLICFELRKKHATWWQIFLVGMVVGGLLEQVTGWSMEPFMGAVSWDYSNVPGHLTKWVSIPFLFMWGLLGLVWTKFVMPWLLWTIGEPTTQRQVVFVALLAAYLGLDIFMTLSCFSRRAERDRGVPPENGFEQWIDDHYTDEFMSERFQNMVING